MSGNANGDYVAYCQMSLSDAAVMRELTMAHIDPFATPAEIAAQMAKYDFRKQLRFGLLAEAVNSCVTGLLRRGKGVLSLSEFEKIHKDFT